MEQISIAYSPAINALVGVFYLKLQLMLWLNESFRCTSFKEVKENANVYVFIDSEGNRSCGRLAYGEYLGCHYAGGQIILNKGTLGQGKEFKYIRYLKGTWIHEWMHEFLPREGEFTSVEKYEKVHC